MQTIFKAPPPARATAPARHRPSTAPTAPRPRAQIAAHYSNAAASPPAAPLISLRLGSAADAATISLPLPVQAARRLDAELRALHATLRAKQEAAESGERPRRWPAMELLLLPLPEEEQGEGGGGGGNSDDSDLTVQLYCNPNAHGSAFDAKVLVRVECRAGGGEGGGGGAASAAPTAVRMTGEARLTDVQGTLEVYWEESKAAGGGQ
jgi:hypothetical protein